MKIKGNIEKNIKLIKQRLGNSSDIIDRKINFLGNEITYVYLESVGNDDKISNYFMSTISSYNKDKIKSTDIFELLKNNIPNSHLNLLTTFEEIFYQLSSGYTCIFIENEKKCLAIETKGDLDRGIEESSSESIIRGPKDSFTENNSTNIGLIRKRIKDPNLWFEEQIIGRRTKSKVTLVYITDIVDLEIVNNIKNKLKNIDIDGIIDSGYIRELISVEQKSIFPRFKSTDRPDLVCTSLLDGKIIIMVENTPFVLITPSFLIDFIHTPEDYYQKSFNVTFTRILRLISLFITILTPGFYIALTTFNQEIIPNKLLISLAVQREGVPFSTSAAIILMILCFEILRECDIRTPNSMGTAVSIVGALILGDAAVSAGIVSPIVIIIIAITSISGLLFTDIDFINALRVWRFFFIILSALLGLVGFVLAGILFTIHLCELETNGIPYLTPFSPIYFKAQKDAILRFPRNKLTTRPEYLAKKNLVRMRVNDEKN